MGRASLKMSDKMSEDGVKRNNATDKNKTRFSMPIVKHLNRKVRVLRLLAVVQAYHYYTMMQGQRMRCTYKERLNGCRATRALPGK
jgi:hypothetical protein